MRKMQDWLRFTPRFSVGAFRPLRVLVASAAVAVLSACASSSMAPKDAGITHDTALGKVLADANGKTLYTYDKDEPGISHCYGLCAVIWPPAAAGEGVSGKDGFTVIPREGGSHQWAYRGKPLYIYISDGQPGDVEGDGVDGVWHVAKP